MADAPLHRLFLDDDLASGASVTLHREEAEHAARSLRLRPGDAFELVNGRGVVAHAVAVRVSARECAAEVGECRIVARPAGPELCLLAGVVRGPRFDFLVEKATELGADVVAPVLSRHSEVRPSGKEKPDRWRRIVIAALKQSRRAWLPAIEPVRTLDDWLESEPASCLWVADPSGGPPHSGGAPVDRCLLLVGPEGGWSESEMQAFRNRGASFISLGNNRLRTETAALTLLVLARDRLLAAYAPR